jgi:hypothetical protein
VLVNEHADVIREAVKAVAAELLELEVSELIGTERRASARRSRDASQRLSAAALGHQGLGKSSYRSRRSARAACQGRLTGGPLAPVEKWSTRS